jgi:hypothetical protein
MSTRSDIGIALKKELIDSLTVEQHEKFLQRHDGCVVRQEGVLYIFKNANSSSFFEFVTFLKANYNPEMYKIVDVCFDFPEVECDDHGWWDNNPWNLRRVISAKLCWGD